MIQNVSKVFLYSALNAVSSLLLFIIFSRNLTDEIFASILFIEVLIRLTPHFSMLGSDQVALKDYINGVNNYPYVILIAIAISSVFIFLMSFIYIELGLLIFITIVIEIFVKLSIDRARAIDNWKSFSKLFFWRRQLIVLLLTSLCLTSTLTIELYFFVLIISSLILVIPELKTFMLNNKTITFQKIIIFMRRGGWLVPHITLFYFLSNLDKFYIKSYFSNIDVVEYLSYFKIAASLMIIIQTFNVVWLPYAIKNSHAILPKQLLKKILKILSLSWLFLFMFCILFADLLGNLLQLESINSYLLFVVMVGVSSEILGESLVYRLHEKEQYKFIALSSGSGIFVLCCGLILSSSLIGVCVSYMLAMLTYNISRSFYSIKI